MGAREQGSNRTKKSQTPRSQKITQPFRQGLARIEGVSERVRLPRLPRVSDAIRVGKLQSIEGISPEAALHASHNFRLGVINGVVFSVVDTLTNPSLVLAWFVSRLGAPNVLVGILPPIMTSGSLLPQMLVASRMQGQPHVMHWYRSMGVVRVLAMLSLAVATVLLAANSTWLLLAFFALYSLYALAGGISSIPWMEMVGKIVPLRRRGTFFGLRSFGAGLVALAAAGPLAAIVAGDFAGLAFPYNFAVLFAVSAIAASIAITAWVKIYEPSGVVSAGRATALDLIKRGAQIARANADYRSFVIVRVLMALASISDPFYIVFARTQLHAPAATIGLYVAASASASLFSNFFWAPLANRASNRTLMSLSILSAALVPLTAVIISLFAGSVDSAILFSAFSFVFVFGGLAAGSGVFVNNNVILALAPPAERATYIGFLNTMLGFATVVPVLGGILADLLGFTILFSVSVLIQIVALLSTNRMSRESNPSQGGSNSNSEQEEKNG